MTKKGLCRAMTIKPWQAEARFRVGAERINVPICFFFSLSLVLSVFLLQARPTSLSGVSQEEGAVDPGKRAGSLPLG